YYFRLVASISMTSVVASRVIFFPKASAKLIPFSEPTKHFSIFFTTIFSPTRPTHHNSTTYTAKKFPHTLTNKKASSSRELALYIMCQKKYS
ncbi:MAG: hypothetical protein PUD41_10275, partial [bacterium]|nr:hypothetical protein [bacterium]